ncbi:UpxY family transcription antiterminator [Bacteroidota bacterium]
MYTKSRAEKKIFEELTISGYEAYLPLIKVLKQWSDRKKWVKEPLIRSYIFVKASEKEYYDILKTNGIVKYVSFEGKAAPIPEWQIETLKASLDNKYDISVTTEKYRKGEIINISQGPLKGNKGEIIEIQGKKKFLIRIENIGYSLLVKCPAMYLESALGVS